MEDLVRSTCKKWGLTPAQTDERVGNLHMCEQVCKDVGLTPFQTAELLATLMFEAGFNNDLTNKNKDKNGNVLSTDWGIAQVNDHYHIGKGKDFPSVQYVLANPKEVVKWMAKLWMAGEGHLWEAYKQGLYKKYLVWPVLPPKPSNLEQVRATAVKNAEAIIPEVVQVNQPPIQLTLWQQLQTLVEKILQMWYHK